MKLRSVVVVMTAALIGVGAPGFAQAQHRGDRGFSNGGHGGGGHQRDSRRDHRDHRSGSNGLGLALGIGLLGAVIASQAFAQPSVQPYGYAPTYPPAGYAPNYGAGAYDYQYVQPGYPQYGYAQRAY